MPYSYYVFFANFVVVVVVVVVVVIILIVVVVFRTDIVCNDCYSDIDDIAMHAVIVIKIVLLSLSLQS